MIDITTEQLARKELLDPNIRASYEELRSASYEQHAAQLAQQGEFAVAIEKLNQISKPTARVIQNSKYYQCHQEFKEGHYAVVVDIAGKQLSECKGLDSQTKTGYQQLRLYSLANGDNTSPPPVSIDTTWQDYKQLQHEIKDAKQQTAQTDAMFRILYKSSRQAIKGDELARALDHYDRMIILKPDEIELKAERRYYEYQMHYQDPKERPSLLAKCKNVLQTTPTDPIALRFSGLIYLQQQDLENAELHFSKLVVAKTDDIEAMMYLTDIARSKQAYSSAQHWAEQAFLQAQNTYKRHIEDKKTETNETHHQEQKARLAQQLAATKKQVETVKSDVFAIWCFAAGKSMGEVTYHLLSDMMQLGVNKMNHQKPAAYDNLILPFWEKAGKQSLPVNSTSMTVPRTTSAVRYFN